MLIKEAKAYQVSLFNNDKGVGMIKYKIDWILDHWIKVFQLGWRKNSSCFDISIDFLNNFIL